MGKTLKLLYPWGILMVVKDLNLVEARKIFEVELGSKVDSIKDSSFGGDHLVFIARIKKKKFVL